MASQYDSSGSAHVVGSTSSVDFPVTPQAIQRVYGGYIDLPFNIEQLLGDAFVSKLSPDGSTLLYSTYLGGSANDQATAVAVDPSGLIYVAGSTDSFIFPYTSDALQTSMHGDGGENQYLEYGDGFLTVIDPNASKPVYSTYFGGSLDDIFLGLSFDPSGNLWLVGNTVSQDFPVTSNAAQSKFGGARNMFVFQGDAMVVEFGKVLSVPSILADGTGVIHGATYQPGHVVSGSWVSIKGSGFTDSTVDWSSFNFSSGVLPTVLNEVQVLFNGVPGSVSYVGTGNPQQINVQAPDGLSGTISVQVVRNNFPSNTVTTSAVQVAPGIFPYTVDNGQTFYPAAIFAGISNVVVLEIQPSILARRKLAPATSSSCMQLGWPLRLRAW